MSTDLSEWSVDRVGKLRTTGTQIEAMPLPASPTSADRWLTRERAELGWIHGGTPPYVAGWYERLFTDGVYVQYFDGKDWRRREDGALHHRQVGDYPCWRYYTPTASPQT